MKITAWKNRTKELRYIKDKVQHWCITWDSQTKVHPGHDYDFEAPTLGRVKIKQDRLAHITKSYLFKPNPKVDTWLVVDNEYCCLVPAKLVGSGYIQRDELFKIPEVGKIQRWFPNKL